MKNAVFIGILVLLSACNYSTKGNWSEEDRELAAKALEKYNLNVEQFGDEVKADYEDCFVGKLENKYENFEEAQKDEFGMQMASSDCLKYIVKSIYDKSFNEK